MKLELIDIKYKEYKGKYYWEIDEEGVYLESIVYDNKLEAISALANNSIAWDEEEIDYNKLR